MTDEVKWSKPGICIAFYWVWLTTKHSGMAHVNERSHSFTCHPHVYPQGGMNHACLYSPAAECHRTLAGTHFPSHWGYEAELARVAGYIPRWFASPKTVTDPSTNRAGHRLTFLMRPPPLPLRQTATTWWWWRSPHRLSALAETQFWMTAVLVWLMMTYISAPFVCDSGR